VNEILFPNGFTESFAIIIDGQVFPSSAAENQIFEQSVVYHGGRIIAAIKVEEFFELAFVLICRVFSSKTGVRLTFRRSPTMPVAPSSTRYGVCVRQAGVSTTP
jgi:hypothetical protein